jgi:hypothetical protein
MAAVMRLVERQSAWPVLARRELVGQLGERASDLIAGGALLARDLGMRGAVGHALGQPRAKTPGHALTRGQVRVRLGDRPPALGAAVAALAPHQPGHSSGDRQIAHAHQWALLDPHLAAAAVSAGGGAREQLDLQVELLARPSHFGHDKAI